MPYPDPSSGAGPEAAPDLDAVVSESLGLPESESASTPAAPANQETSGETPANAGGAAEASEPPEPPAGEAPAEGGEASPEGEAPPEGEKPAEGDAAKRPFKILLKDGTEAEIEQLDEIEFAFTADGKERKVPLEKLVRYAQNGFYNHRLQQEVQQARDILPKYQQQLTELQQELAETNKLAERLLTDEAYLERAQAEYQRLNSPEARAERAERKLSEREQQEQQQQQARRMADYLVENVVPKYEALLQQYPTVTHDEAWGRFNLLTAPMLVRGQLPPERLPEVARAIEQELAPWAAQLHESRTSDERRKTEARDAEVRKAQEKATLAKKQVARALKPVAKGSGTSTQSQPKPKAIVTADDAMEDVIGSALRASA